jgi:aminoglycoside phosphotransferase (APT) family kinase protein
VAGMYPAWRRAAAPRLLAADLDGDAAGCPAQLVTALAGDSSIPAAASPARLRALGPAAAQVHAVAAVPRAELPPRSRPLADVDFAARRRSSGSSPLLDSAEQRVNQLPAPQGISGFIHGDLWHGNTVWKEDALVGFVDWDAAGIGLPGIDLGTLRNDAAVLFGPRAAADVLDGWQQATGQTANNPCCSRAGPVETTEDRASMVDRWRRSGRSK